MGERIKGVKPKEYKGVKYRSTLEKDTAELLDSLSIPFQYEGRRIELLPAFRCSFQKAQVIHITYLPDFILPGNIILECKGYETPEWKLKKKLIFKYLKDNEPDATFYQVHDARKSLLLALDNHWTALGFFIETSPKPQETKNKKPALGKTKHDSIQEAMQALGLTGKPVGPILNALTGKKPYIYNYSWKLSPLKI